MMDNIESLFKKKGCKRVLAVEPGGNPGDGLIYRGWYKMADRLNIKYDIISKDSFGLALPLEYTGVKSSVQALAWHVRIRTHQLLRNYDAIYIHGSGGFNDIWNATTYIYAHLGDIFDCPLIVGPQSVYFDETDPHAIFETVSTPVYFFTREKYSFDILKPVVERHENIELNLSPDTALYLDEKDLTVDTDPKYTLYSFRDDRESCVSDEDLPAENTGKVRREDIAQVTNTVEEYMQAIASADEVHTDRLHIGVGSSILGKDVTIYDNRYHKNRGIYEYCLSEYPNTKFKYLRDAPVAE